MGLSIVQHPGSLDEFQEQKVSRWRRKSRRQRSRLGGWAGESGEGELYMKYGRDWREGLRVGIVHNPKLLAERPLIILLRYFSKSCKCSHFGSRFT
jgi:hypothetical protein